MFMNYAICCSSNMMLVIYIYICCSYNNGCAVEMLSASNAKTPGDISPAYRIYVRLGLWQLRIKHNSFTIFTMIPNNSMKESSRVFELLFFVCVFTVKKRNFQSLKNTFDNLPCTRDYVNPFSSL